MLTAKHRDGYALCPSEQCSLGTGTHLGGRDLIQPYVDACRKTGIKVGIYFSFADWRLRITSNWIGLTSVFACIYGISFKQGPVRSVFRARNRCTPPADRPRAAR